MATIVTEGCRGTGLTGPERFDSVSRVVLLCDVLYEESTSRHPVHTAPPDERSKRLFQEERNYGQKCGENVKHQIGFTHT